jgi:cell division protein FtsB
LIALLIAVVILMSGVMTCIPLIREKAVRKRVQLELQEELRVEIARAREMELDILSVKKDPATVERLAREKFGLARPGEMIFKFRSDMTPAEATNAAAAAAVAGRSRL